MLTRRHFLKMIGYGTAGVAAIKIGGMAAAKSLMSKPEFKGNLAGKPLPINEPHTVNFTISGLKPNDQVLAWNPETEERFIDEQIKGPQNMVSTFISEPQEVTVVVRNTSKFYDSYILPFRREAQVNAGLTVIHRPIYRF